MNSNSKDPAREKSNADSATGGNANDPGKAEEAVRGKKAIVAEQHAKGSNPADKTEQDKEKKDANNWRNEG